MRDKPIDILFLGRMFPDKNEDKWRKKARVDMQDAANLLQWNLVNGIVSNNPNGKMNVEAYLPVDSWPKHYEDAFIKHEHYLRKDNVYVDVMGFCNITYIKQLFISSSCIHSIKKWAKKNSSNEKLIICYTCNNAFMSAIKKAKKINPRIKAIQIIADITEYAANDEKKGLKKWFIKRQIVKNKKLMQEIDGFVLLTEQMSQKLEITKPYMVMEGIAPSYNCEKNIIPETNKKTIVYTGSMNKKYGIITLLDAFKLIEGSEYELILCGLGNAEPVIKERASQDSRIHFMGKVDHQKILELQRSATVLVNPRQNNEEFTKYSFPSKILEYLSAGVPIVAYKLDGISNEYNNYLHYVESDDPFSLAKVIKDVCSLSKEQRQKEGINNATFVNENKNSIVQTEKILAFYRKYICD